MTPRRRSNARKHRDALSRLLGAVPKTRFLDRIWAQSSCVVHADAERLGRFAALPFLKSADALLTHVDQAASNDVRVKAWFQDANGRQTGALVSAAAARQLYRAGNMTIVVDDLDAIVPDIRELLEEIQSETGTPGSMSCNAYLSPPGAGTRMHFDPQESFLVQLVGRKKWLYAPNEQIQFPGSSLKFLDVEERAKIERRFPKQMPKSAKQTVLKPGSVLYMTRGTWHESKSLSHSLALTLTFTSDTWSDLVLQALTQRLVANEAWRKPAVGVTSSGDRQALADRVLEERLRALRDEVLAMGNFER